MKRRWYFLIGVLLACILGTPNFPIGKNIDVNIVSSVYAASTTINFEWDANTEADLAGYRLYQKNNIIDPYPPTPLLDIPAGTTTASIVVADGTYFWVLTAYDMSGNESPYSNEVTSSPDAPPDAPGNFRIVP